MSRAPSRLLELLLRTLPERFREAHRDELLELLREYTVGRSRWVGAAMQARAAIDILWVSALLRWQESPARRAPSWLETAGQDVRHCLRSLHRDPGFTTCVTLVLGLGIGVCSTVLAVAHTLLLRPLPFAEPERLVWISNGEWGRGQALSELAVQAGHLQELRAESRALEGVAGYSLFDFEGDHVMTGDGEPERVTRLSVTEGFFELLGVSPSLGRHFTAEELAWGGPPAALLLHGFWVRRFAADPGVLGRSITVDGAPVTVVGVLPATFDFATIFAPGSRVDYAVPFPMGPETHRRGNTLAAIARLRPGATPEQAQAEARAIAERPRGEGWNRFAPSVTPLRERVSGALRPAVLVLVGAVSLVMLIVCANVANLLVARGAVRRRELALRAALGAGRRRLVRQMLTESLVLASSGALLGLVLSGAGLRAASRLGDGMPLLAHARMEPSVLALTLGIAWAAGLLFGVAPAMRLSASALGHTLREGGRAQASGRRQGRLRGGLVVSEVALACTLLVGAGLLTRSLFHLLEVDLGFDPGNTVAIRIDPALGFADPAGRDRYNDEALRHVRTAAGVAAATLSDVLPTAFNRSWCVRRDRQDEIDPRAAVCPFVRVVGDDYARAMGLTLLAGRDVAPSDDGRAEAVALVNETLARTLWGEEEALGRSLHVDEVPRRVVGVVRGTRHLGPEQEPGPEVFIPLRQVGVAWTNATYLIARGALSSPELGASVGAELRRFDSGLPVHEVVVVRDLLDRALSPHRVLAALLVVFAAFALLLASLGIFGVISYSVRQRTREIGLRMALGASGARIRARVLSETLGLASVGVACGLPGAWLLAQAMAGLLYGVEPTDPATFAAVPLVLIAVAGLAGYIPASQAARLEPAAVLSEW